jgi:gamma-glutamyltranspeptidase
MGAIRDKRTKAVQTDIKGDPAAGAAVASDDQAATDAAWAVLESGRTAVDAAIAGALTLYVTMPHAASRG